MAVVALTASLPLAGALAGPASDAAPESVRDAAAVRDAGRALADPRPGADAKPDPQPGADGDGQDRGQAEERVDGKQSEGGAGQRGDGAARQPQGDGGGLLSGLGLGTATRCGPELASPEGVEAQTCVLQQAGDIWARTYYRNATGGGLRSVLTLMGPGGRTVQMHCVVGADDEPGACETPREPARGKLPDYSAIAEFAAPEGQRGADEEQPLLLRSGSN